MAEAADQVDQLLVRDIMGRNPAVVAPATTIAEAALLMGERNIGAVMVCRDGAVLGIFSERDLMRRAATERHRWESTPVAVVMTPDPIMVSSDATWAAAMDLMDRCRVRHLPVVDADRLVGMLSLRDLLRHRATFLETVVQQRTADLEAKNEELRARDELMRFHLDLAGRIQRHMLPANLPRLPPFEFAVTYRPLDRVSGDYYDFANVCPNRLGIMIADASGHSVPAAFVSVMAKSAFEACCQGFGSPAAVLCRMNEQLSTLIEAGHFITMFYAIVDRRDLTLTYAIAGHPAPFWFQAASGTVVPLEADGAMIGVVPEPRFEERTVQLSAGDLVLLYTDGVIECQDAERQLFGRPRLAEFLRQRGQRSCAAMVQELEAELTRHRGEAPLGDDVTGIAMKVGY